MHSIITPTLFPIPSNVSSTPKLIPIPTPKHLPHTQPHPTTHSLSYPHPYPYPYLHLHCIRKLGITPDTEFPNILFGSAVPNAVTHPHNLTWRFLWPHVRNTLRQTEIRPEKIVAGFFLPIRNPTNPNLLLVYVSVCAKLGGDKTIFGSSVVVMGVRYAWYKYGRREHATTIIQCLVFVVFSLAATLVFGLISQEQLPDILHWKTVNLILQIIVLGGTSYIFWLEVVKMTNTSASVLDSYKREAGRKEVSIHCDVIFYYSILSNMILSLCTCFSLDDCSSFIIYVSYLYIQLS
jgi:hypothetical protein